MNQGDNITFHNKCFQNNSKRFIDKVDHKTSTTVKNQEIKTSLLSFYFKNIALHQQVNKL